MQQNLQLRRGMEITVSAFGGKQLRRRVWEDLGRSILVCKEEEYQQAITEQREAVCSGFPKEDVMEIH